MDVLEMLIGIMLLIPIGIYHAFKWIVAGIIVLVQFIAGLFRKTETVADADFIEVDRMDGARFEHFVANVLRKNGFHGVSVTKASGDYGVDVTASKDGQKWAFQCKRYQGVLGLKPIQEVYAGAKKYGADRAVVVTNSHFTKNAKELADNLGVDLWDRDMLARKSGTNSTSMTSMIGVSCDDVPADKKVPVEIDPYPRKTPAKNAVAPIESKTQEHKKSEEKTHNKEDGDMATKIGAGRYVFGEDLPLGKYDLKTISGSGALCIQKNDQKDDEGFYAEAYVYLASEAKNGASGYKGLSLPNGWYFTLDGNVVVEITKSKMLVID